MEKRMRSICVFCGSSAGSEEVYAESARRLGEYFARNQIRLVFGGGSFGIFLYHQINEIWKSQIDV